MGVRWQHDNQRHNDPEKTVFAGSFQMSALNTHMRSYCWNAPIKKRSDTRLPRGIDEAQYGQDFDSFRQQVLTSDPDEKIEQDYFDWEMATTGSSDMQDEIERLSGLFATS